MIKTNWQKGTLVEPARVLSDGTIKPAKYEGATPLSPEMLNQMENNIEMELESIKEKVNKTWTLIDTVKGANAISLPENFSELYIKCNVGNDVYSNLIIKEVLTGTYQSFDIGGRSTVSSMGAGVTVKISLTSVMLNYLYSNGVDRTKDTYTAVFYK